MVKNRVIGLDIIRCLAIFFVISVHYFLNNGFYGITLNSPGSVFLLFFRSLFFTCVPLFLLLTGYLNRSLKFDKAYFYKLFKVLLSYFIIAIIALIFRILYLDENIGLLKCIISIFSFEADPYAWYVEMYIGLFLLIPFLNILYNNLNKKNIQLLILVLFFMTAIPPLTNHLIFDDTAIKFLPGFWETFYPITYFFIGRYLYEYKIEMNNNKKLILIILLLFVQSILVFIYCYKKTFDWSIFNGFGNLFTLIIACLIFLIFLNKNIKNKFFNSFIIMVSKLSFEMYLLSYIFDKIFYKIIKLEFNNTLNYLENYFVYVPLVFLCSFVVAFLINKISNILYVKIKPLYDKITYKF